MPLADNEFIDTVHEHLATSYHPLRILREVTNIHFYTIQPFPPTLLPLNNLYLAQGM